MRVIAAIFRDRATASRAAASLDLGATQGGPQLAPHPDGVVLVARVPDDGQFALDALRAAGGRIETNVPEGWLAPRQRRADP